MTVTLILPSMLKEAVGTMRLRVQGATLGEALEEAYRALPALRHHLCEPSGELRAHVLCFHQGRTTRRLDLPVKEGDEITVLQAISGG